MSGQTPRVEHCLSLDNGGNGLLSFKRIIELARELEREGHQTRTDAALDARRLIDDKMKLREELAEAVAALKPFANFHCNDPTCKCNNCVARAIVARMGG